MPPPAFLLAASEACAEACPGALAPGRLIYVRPGRRLARLPSGVLAMHEHAGALATVHDRAAFVQKMRDAVPALASVADELGTVAANVVAWLIHDGEGGRWIGSLRWRPLAPGGKA
jgi:hypothetical protein